jgi:flagellar basal body L-ring protein FlgH
MIPSSAVEETDKNILRKESPVDEANVFSSRSFTKSSKTMKKEKMLSLWIAARAVWSLQEGIYSVASRKETRLEMRMASFAFLGGNPKIPQSTAERFVAYYLGIVHFIFPVLF